MALSISRLQLKKIVSPKNKSLFSKSEGKVQISQSNSTLNSPQDKTRNISVLQKTVCKTDYSPDGLFSFPVKVLLNHRRHIQQLSVEHITPPKNPPLADGTEDEYLDEPSVDTPNRKNILKLGLNARKKWMKLGLGSFGTVFQARYKDEVVAVKLISGNKHAESLRSEGNAVNLCHQNIVTMLKVVNEDEPFGMVVMELCKGQKLQSLIEDVSFDLNFCKRINYAIDIASAIEYCHNNAILHLDIKPGNVIVTSSGTCKLCDFGKSQSLKTKPNGKKSENIGTIIFTDPEILGRNHASEKSDVYSFGITLWQLLSRENPYESYNMHTHSIIYQVVVLHLRPREVVNVSLQDVDYVQLYKECWKQMPIERPTINQVLEKLISFK